MRLVFTWCLGGCVASTVLLVSTQTFRRALTRSVDSCADIRVPLQWHNQFWQSGGKCRKAMLGAWTRSWSSEPVWPNGKAWGWLVSKSRPRFDSASAVPFSSEAVVTESKRSPISAVPSLQKLWSIEPMSFCFQLSPLKVVVNRTKVLFRLSSLFESCG